MDPFAEPDRPSPLLEQMARDIELTRHYVTVIAGLIGASMVIGLFVWLASAG